MSMIGKTLAHYEITSRIGKGGMGEVYKAKDQKLGRDVAIKVLPEEFAEDADRVARFQREAKLLASLNHPNIAAIYGLEESDGSHFLVLELIEGDRLADRIKSGPIPVEESLKLALQIAEALEAAHEKGVIHRDLKPANIKVTPDGKVKVLDFGLAKAFAGDQVEVNLSNSPTLSVAATQQGVILGTAAYMSPEQAKGKSVDKRADVWAFGCVLYEMLTGRTVFAADDVSQTLARVLERRPDFSMLPPNLHPRIRLLLERCLEKEPKDRCHDIADVRVDIQKALADPSGVFVQPATVAEPRTRLRTILPWIAAAVVVGAIIAGVVVWNLRTPEPRQVTRFSYELPKDQQLFGGSTERALAISPDGRRFVYATSTGLYLRSMDALDSRLITGTARAQNPFFSPDGRWIGYWSSADNRLKKIAISGGAPVTLTDAAPTGSLSWEANDRIIYGRVDKGFYSLVQISANGGPPELIAKGDRGYLIHPQILPGGESLLFTEYIPSNATYKVVVQSLKSGVRKELFAAHAARYLPTGHIVYEVENNLFAVPFDLDKLEISGDPVPLVEGILKLNAAQYAVSDSGTLVYIPGTTSSSERTLVWVDRDGKEEAIEAPSRKYAYAHLSPDGTRVALDIRDQEYDIWIWDLARKTLSRLTFDPGMNRGGIWTPDGKKLAFSAERDGAENIYWQSADGSGTPEPLTQNPKGSILPKAFSPDGKQLLFNETTLPYDISLLSLNGSNEPKRLLGTSFNENNPQISPDGRWLAYQSDESGRAQIYVRPFPNVNAGRWQISTEGGTRPLWSANGRELFYYVDPGTMMAVPVETGTSFKAGSPTIVFKGEYLSLQAGTQYSVTADGRRFLMIKAAAAKEGNDASPQRINIVLNWFEELKQRVPIK
jgi:serine/threonine protein kinase